MQSIIYLKLYLMLLFLSLATSIDSYAQKIDIMSIHVDSSIKVKQNILYGSFMGLQHAAYFTIVPNGPGMVFNVALINDSTNTLTLLTKKTHAYLKYDFNGRKITMESGLGIFSDDILPGEVINIQPQQTLEFQLLFGLLPEYGFSAENYARNIWQIIPTLQIELELHKPKGMTVVSEPLNWKSITISGE